MNFLLYPQNPINDRNSLTFVGTGHDFEDMVIDLRKVYDRLLAAGLKLKAKICHLFCKKVVYLGHVISEAGIATDPEIDKVQTLSQKRSCVYHITPASTRT
jgi:hypothetical protein